MILPQLTRDGKILDSLDALLRGRQRHGCCHMQQQNSCVSIVIILSHPWSIKANMPPKKATTTTTHHHHPPPPPTTTTTTLRPPAGGLLSAALALVGACRCASRASSCLHGRSTRVEVGQGAPSLAMAQPHGEQARQHDVDSPVALPTLHWCVCACACACA
jgi:hypothetical protein